MNDVLKPLATPNLFLYYLVPKFGGLLGACTGESLLSWQAFGMWDKCSHILGTLFKDCLVEFK